MLKPELYACLIHGGDSEAYFVSGKFPTCRYCLEDCHGVKFEEDGRGVKYTRNVKDWATEKLKGTIWEKRLLKTGFPWHTDFHDAMKLNEVKLKEKGMPLGKQEGGSHYKDKKIQPVEYAHANNLGFMEANVVKYITRHKDKNKAEDIRKAIHYCQLILELEYNEGVK